MSRNVKRLVFCAMCIALSTVTGSITLFSLQNGGSVTPFSMLFATLPGLFFGPVYGIATGAAYGILNLILKPYIYTPLQVLIDYPLAFGALGLSGLFSKRKNGLFLGYLTGCLGRFFFSFLSGYVFFASYAPAGMHPALYSAGYNFSYIAAEAALTLILLFIPAIRNAIFQVRSWARAEGSAAKPAKPAS